MYRLIGLIGAVVAATCLVAGCGSSGDEATSAPLTKAQFIKQADAICAKVTEEREAAVEAWKKEQPAGSAETPDKVEEGLKEVIAPALQHQAEEMGALAAPTKDRAEVAQMVSTLATASQAMEREPKQAFQSNLPQFEREAKAYGFKTCRRVL